MQRQNGFGIETRLGFDDVGLREVEAQQEREVRVGLEDDDPGPEGALGRALAVRPAPFEAWRKNAQCSPSTITN